MQHDIVKNGDTISAILTVDGAWIDTGLRKLAVPPAKVAEVFSHLPMDAAFQWLD